MSLPCFYSVSAINYKNQFCSVCPRQSDRLSYEYLPTKIFNDVGFVELRNKLQQDIWPTGCDLCEEMELESNHSMRFDYPYPVNDYAVNGFVHNNGLRHVEFRFSNACNMSCLHCSSVFSSEWERKLKTYKPDEFDFKYDLRQLLNTEHKITPDEKLKIKLTPSMIKEICEDLKNFENLSYVDVTGGEPLYQKHFYVFLENIMEHPNVKNMKLKFHTNFNTDFDPKNLCLYLKEFDRVKMTISVDAGKNIYSYFRDGNWDVLKNNIAKFREIDRETKIFATCTTSAFQMLDIYNIFDSLLTLDVDEIRSSIVQTPKYLNPRVVKKFDLNRYILNEIERTFELNLTPTAYGALTTIKKYFVNSVFDELNYRAFLNYIDKTQKLFGKDFNKYYKSFKYETEQIRFHKNTLG